MEIDFTFAGFPETLRAIDALPGLLGARVQGDGLIAAARVARDEARKLAPVKNGRSSAHDTGAARVSASPNGYRKEENPRRRRRKFWPANRDARRGADRGRL